MMAYTSPLFSIDPEFGKRIHPEALKELLDWEKAKFPWLKEKGITGADILKFLEDPDKARIREATSKIWESLKTCMDVPAGATLYDVYYLDNILWKVGIISDFKRAIFLPLYNIESLVSKGYDRMLKKEAEAAKERQRQEEERQRQAKEEERQQAAKAKEEQRKREGQAEAERKKKEDEERRAAARKAIKPPIDDAKRYLNRPGEYDKFIQSIEGAIDAYLAEPEGYLDNMKAHKYKWCLIEISDRRQEEAQKLRATLAANEYNHCLNQEIAKLTSQLEHKRKDLLSYFQAKIQDKRYTGHNFDYVPSAEEKHSFDGTLVSVANKKLEQLISNDLRQFIDIPSQYYRIYLPLPSIDYSLEGIPCLNFCFDVFAAAYAEVWLKPGKKSFGGYEFHLPRIEEKNYSVLLQEPRFLGYYYLILRPEDLGGYIFWQSIPLVLLKGLLNGETKPMGTTISAASDGMITYKIPKFKEEVNIPNKFANYLKDIGSIDEMVSKFKMNEKVASIVRAESEELKVEHKALSLEEKTEGKHTKKAKAFLLFSQGKGPSSPEVKTLGLHKSTRFKYYNQYLAVHKP